MSTELITSEFSIMLKAFDSIISNSPAPEKVKKELDELNDAASNSAELNHRQKEAITSRIANYRNGTYGNTKSPEHYQQGKPSSKNG